MITADTITDEQIRELLVTATDQPARDLCNIALGVLFLPCWHKHDARARCAEILNARAGDARETTK